MIDSAPVPLEVFVDGVALPEGEARAFWKRFSAYMDEHAGDLGGFAHAEGFASVHPELREAGAVLVVSRAATQRPYTNVSLVTPRSTAGSGAAGGGARGGRAPPTSRGKRR